MKLAQQIALITGGTSGIGEATARLFAQMGATVVITGRTASKGQAIAAEIGGLFIESDIRQARECQRIVDETIRHYGAIDILFNNAGIVPYGTILETSAQVWEDVWATNVSGTFYTTQACLPGMIARGKGVIVNNASDWGIVGGQGALAYCTTKGAIVQMTKSLALDHARQGIRVNAVCPGDTYVERWRRTRSDEEMKRYLKEDGALFPLGRVGQAEEIAQAVLFLASSDSSYMTGQMLVIDGGNTAGGASTVYAQGS